MKKSKEKADKGSAKTTSGRFANAPAAQDRKPSLTLVGIGASAGGLEAISGLLSGLPARDNVAVVIIQHRAKEDSSLMPSLLAKHTPMEILEIQDGMKIKPNRVYINLPHKEVFINNQTFYVNDYQNVTGAVLPIDSFFTSLATQFGKRAVSIILSGTGSDGAHGLIAVKAAGGLTIVQDEKQAKYKGMPQSAIDTRQVDIVLRVEDMGAQIKKYANHTFIKDSGTENKTHSDNVLGKICSIIHKCTGHDLSGYKINTLKRRVHKRMALHQIQDEADYVHFLEENKKEVEALFDDALITVTSFFRDPQVWESVRKNALENLVKNKPAESSIRAWVAGCATGEEAYSAVILLLEEMHARNKQFVIEVFATDVNSHSIRVARKGIYPRHIEADMPDKALLERYFDAADNGYKIKKHVREMVVFAEQNVIQDPPFSNVDILFCRNMLIYMKAPIQKRMIASFHYSLNPGGYLVLGTSETLGELTEHFSVVDSKNRIFQSLRATDFQDQAKLNRMPIGGRADAALQKTDRDRPETDYNTSDVCKVIEKLILQNYTSPCVLLDGNWDIVYLCGDTGKYLRITSGRASFNFLQMVRPEIYHTLGTVLHRAMEEQETFVKENLRIKIDDEIEVFDLLVRPVKIPGHPLFVLLVFQAAKAVQTIALSQKPTAQADRASWEEQLRKELQETRQYLNTTIQELETRNEQLQISNEELQSTNEEFKTTNEELETSREELQSTNEELRSVNEERARQNEELLNVRDDLQNLLSSTKVATIFLDTGLHIKRYTPEAAGQFHFRVSDIGRPLGDITHNLNYESLLEDAESVLDHLATVEKEIGTKNGGTLLVRMMPYRTTQNVIEGVVITLIDMTSEKYAREYAEDIVETIREPLVVLDREKRVISANRAFYKKFQTTPDEVRNKIFYDLGNGQWNIPELKELIEKVLPNNHGFEDFVVEHEFPQVGWMKIVINARQITNKAIKTERILLAIEEVSKNA